MCLGQHMPVAIERAANVVIQLQSTAGQNCAAVAILTHGPSIVGNKDDIRAENPLTKSRCTFAAKTLVADLGDFVD